MEIRQLKYFISAATHLNFTKAAQECFIVQSSMTEQIAKLEGELGVRLFERQTRGLSLTEAGAFFLLRAKAILAESEKAEKEMSAFRAGYTSLLRIGYYGELFKRLLIESLRAYHEELPTGNILLCQLPDEELSEKLWEGQLDLILIPDRESVRRNEQLESVPIMTMGPMLAVGKNHPLANRKSVTAAEVGQMRLINLGESGKEELKKLGQGCDPLDMVQDHTSNEILVASGFGASLWAERLPYENTYPDLRFIEVTEFGCTKTFMLAWQRGKLTAEGELLRNIICENAKKDG